ncbi:MAG: glycosyltransferase [Ignavibacteriales bacterium]|nr:glycosyltransferase [Ignavibacteriales bacterium]
MFALFLLVTAYYCVVIILLAVGLRKIKFEKSAEKPFVSIIVAARNEEQAIGRLLEQLTRQRYPSYEIIIVNDRSTDTTASIVRSYQQAHPNLRLIDIDSLDGDMPSKKNALAKGIAASKGEIFCFTDADCIPTVNWVEELVAAFGPDVGLVAGYSPYDRTLLWTEPHKTTLSEELFLKFIEYEEFKGAVWSAGAIGWNKGWLCTGRTLAYRKTVYEEVGGFEKIKQSVSGDDDLFLQLVRRETSWDMRYVASPESFVRTAPPATFSQFLQQRIRHFSAGKFFSLPMKLFFFLFHSSNLLLLAGWIIGLFFDQYVYLLWGFLAKIVVDILLLFSAGSTFRQTRFTASFLLMEIIYIFYNTLIGPLGFIKKFEWKQGQKT